MEKIDRKSKLVGLGIKIAVVPEIMSRNNRNQKKNDRPDNFRCAGQSGIKFSKDWLICLLKYFRISWVKWEYKTYGQLKCAFARLIHVTITIKIIIKFHF